MIKNSPTQVCFFFLSFFLSFPRTALPRIELLFLISLISFSTFSFFISFQSFNAEISEKSISRGINVACNTNKNISKNLFHFSSIIVRAYKSCQTKRLVGSGYLL